jgi:HD-GYP domain-containing protein (c-di-GMP phosphodiesterase class II)
MSTVPIPDQPSRESAAPGRPAGTAPAGAGPGRPRGTAPAGAGPGRPRGTAPAGGAPAGARFPRRAAPPPGALHLLARLEERGLAAHAREVAALSERVCRALALPDLLVDRIVVAALLHDVGKVELPPSVLDRPGPLSPAEWRVVRSHPIRSARLVAEVPGLATCAPWLRAHHERWDGRGYPDRLAGERIPLGARVIHACDSFDAMTRDRCYRPALTFDEACAELLAGARAQFDPVVAQALVSVVRDK